MHDGRGDATHPLPPRHERHKACLHLSMIVLIGYIFASGFGLWTGQLPRYPGDSPVPAGAFPSTEAYPAAVDSGGKVPRGVRQRYLLGHRIDVNRAGAEEISTIPGISDATAQALVEVRNRNGGFRRPEELLHVRGIKQRRLKKILPFLTGFHNN